MAVLCAALAAAHPVRADEIAAWLEERGLTSLLATHLEAEMDAARDPERKQQLAARLAAAYVRLLEAASPGEDAQVLEARARTLLRAVDGQDADELHLALAGASQRAAARIAERHRLRMASEEEVESARASFRRLLTELGELRRGLAKGLTSLQRRLSRSGGVDATILAEAVERQERLVAQATYLAAWTSCYLATLDDDDALMRDANRLFVELLDTGVAAPLPDDVSLDLRGLEPYARAILGVALCRAATQPRPTEALDWLALLEHEKAYAPLRAELGAWRLHVLLEGGDWSGARDELDRQLEGAEEMPAAWIRLVAARSLEAAATSKEAEALARRAVAALASRGELGQVLDLARRYGTMGFGDSGFVLRYVRGVERFDAARLEHGEEAFDRRAATAYEEAANELAAAIAEPDAASFPEASAGAQALLAWCRYYQGRLVDAAEAFELASERQPAPEAAESLWMAIACLERGGASAELEARTRGMPGAATLVRRFLDRFPASPRAPHLLLRRARSEGATPELVEQLLAVPSNSDAHGAARRQAVQSLYELYRSAVRDGEPGVGAALGRELLAVAVPVLEEDDVRLEELDRLEREAHLVRARQALEVALAPDVGRPELARSILQRVDVHAAGGRLDVTEAADELAFRRIQVLLAVGEGLAAAQEARALLERTTAPMWTDAVSRELFRDAVTRWRSSSQPEDDPAALAAVVEWGERLLRAAEAAGEDSARREALAAPTALPVLAAVAEAGARLWQHTRDEPLAGRTRRRLDDLRAIRSTDVVALRWGAVLAEGLGDHEEALDRLRVLLSGAEPGSDLWFESKWRQIAILVKVDPVRARAVLDQHKALHPDLGPPPWGERLRQLDQETISR